MPHENIQGVWPAIHGGVMVAGLAFANPVPLAWPWYLLLPLAGYVCLALIVPPLRRTMPKPSPGQVDRVGAIAAMVLVVTSTAALLGYQKLFQPDVSYLAAKLPESFFDSLLVGGLCFSLVNAALEELICRWVLYEAVAAEWGVISAMLVTSVFFGVAHIEGYPPGPWGAILAGAYGVALAILRWWSGGLALAVGCHICADATIFWIVCDGGK